MTSSDVEVAIGAAGVLRDFSEAGVLDISDVHVARRICTLGEEPDERIALAVALVVRALRSGSVCVDLPTIAATIGPGELPWPDGRAVAAGVAGERVTRLSAGAAPL